jgi:tetratricopeptide (TPR) repeat protein
LASYEQCLQLAPDMADAHYNLASLHEQLGNRQKALRHLNAYRRLQR